MEKLSERMFEGFSRESVDFLWNIRFNNYRSWYQEHKEECRRYVDGPMKALAAQLLDTLSREHPEMGLVCKVSRIYRDTRRLYGRPPYRDCMWFSIFSQVRSPEGQTSFYFELAPERYSCGLGCWGATSQTMARLRGIVDRDPRRVEGLMRQLEAQGEFQLESRPYKRPKGDPGPLLAPLYNRGTFYPGAVRPGAERLPLSGPLVQLPAGGCLGSEAASVFRLIRPPPEFLPRGRPCFPMCGCAFYTGQGRKDVLY